MTRQLKRTRFVGRTFMKGLVVVAPIAATVYLAVWIVRDLESIVRNGLLKVLPEDWYVPGLGFAVAVAGVLTVGLLMYPWLTRKVIELADRLLRKVPLFGSIYGPARDLMNVLSGDMTQRLDSVVMVTVPNTEMETLAFVTREDDAGLPAGMIKDEHVVVFVQWSTQIGGYCFIVPKDSVRPVDMTIEEGLRFALTAGISGPARNQEDAPTQNKPKVQPANTRGTKVK